MKRLLSESGDSPLGEPRRELGEEGRPSVGVMGGPSGGGGAVASLAVLSAMEGGTRRHIAGERLAVGLGRRGRRSSTYGHTATTAGMSHIVTTGGGVEWRGGEWRRGEVSSELTLCCKQAINRKASGWQCQYEMVWQYASLFFTGHALDH
ncbi:hypothetical protein J6590_033778 [Homalodisca vitripennis]|nr:hypothetical protein J6590_033778 [Homalodisca vitripennis]